MRINKIMEKKLEKNKEDSRTTFVLEIGDNLTKILEKIFTTNVTNKDLKEVKEQIKIMSESIEELKAASVEMQTELDNLQQRVTDADARDEESRQQLQEMITSLEARVAELEGDDVAVDEVTTALKSTIADAKEFLAEEEPA